MFNFLVRQRRLVAVVIIAAAKEEVRRINMKSEKSLRLNKLRTFIQEAAVHV